MALASFNEKLLLSNGICISPLKGQGNSQTPQGRSLRDVVYDINNEQDLRDYVTSYAPRAQQKQGEAHYEPHHVRRGFIQWLQDFLINRRVSNQPNRLCHNLPIDKLSQYLPSSNIKHSKHRRIC